MLNYDLLVTDKTDTINGFDQAQEDGISKRLKNRKALMEIADEYSKRGVALDDEAWAKETRGILGPAAFLSTTTPSADALAAMRTSQNAAADEQKEKLRREQFNADIKESNDMATYAGELMSGGDDPVEAYDKLIQRFGAERASKIKDKLGTIKGKAEFNGMREGMEIGKAMIESEAEEYIKANPFLTEAQKGGIRKASQSNTSSMTSEVMKMAESIGMSGGYTGNEIDSTSFRDMIKTKFPQATPEMIDELQKKAITTAERAAQQFVNITNNTQKKFASETIARQDGEMFLKAIGQEQDEKKTRAARAAEYARGGDEAIKAQASLIERVNGNKKTGAAPLVSDPAQRGLMNEYLTTHHVTDFEGLRAAVESGDSKKIKAVVAGFEPMPIYQERVRTAGMIANMQFPNVSALYQRGASLGGSDEEVKKLGKQYQNNLTINNTSEYEDYSEPEFDSMGNVVGSVVKQRVSRGDKSEQANAARDTAEKTRLTTVDSAVMTIKGLREAAMINESIDANPDEVAAEEMKLAQRIARNFTIGAGLQEGTPGFTAASDAMMRDILQKAGVSTGLVRAKTAADKIEEYRKNTAANLSLRQPGMGPAATTPASGGYTPRF